MLGRVRIVGLKERLATCALNLATSYLDARFSVCLPVPNVTNFDEMPDMMAQFVIR
jgi:hypothetical protein